MEIARFIAKPVEEQKLRTGSARPGVTVAVYLGLAISLFCLALLFFHFFYFARFHSDSAVAYIIAGAILDSGSLFPTDFLYGHDIFFLRPQFVIAAVRALGVNGYKAYTLSLSLTLALSVAMVALTATWTGFKRWQALLTTILAVVPWGFTEYDYLIGQQSHLLQACLAFVFVFSTLRAERLAAPQQLAVMFFCMGLISSDSPARGLILAGGYLFVTALRMSRTQRRVASHVAGLLGFIVGASFDVFISDHVVKMGIGHALFFDSTTAVFNRASTLIFSYFNIFAGMDILSGARLDAIVLLIYYSKAAASIALLACIPAMIGRCLVMQVPEIACSDVRNQSLLFVGAVGAALVLLATPVVLGSRLDNDVRHLLVGLLLVKFAFIGWLVVRLESRRFGHRVLAGACLIAFVTASSPIMVFVSPELRQRELRAAREVRTTLQKGIASLRGFTDANGPLRVYGTFWNALKYEVLLGQRVEAVPIVLDGTRIVASSWATRPSRLCGPASALYFVGDDEHALAEVLLVNGARRTASIGSIAVYQGSSNLVSGCRKDGAS